MICSGRRESVNVRVADHLTLDEAGVPQAEAVPAGQAEPHALAELPVGLFARAGQESEENGALCAVEFYSASGISHASS
ncbi:hypothetical protein ADL15_02690 [Actinoplanes awajinensis subsp. mycoplanecinus]|uniref:Uncharacterized protein n=1 Tax=Actinoplanes awajinensis subsp. mycoplanecinus TaxID=135947 RepID=A0A0X3VB79_9ACTN|nr:hypothetical protein ADL15_02690 [Actinoplanes awajinensis subsp. mycoplanecinus]